MPSDGSAALGKPIAMKAAAGHPPDEQTRDMERQRALARRERFQRALPWLVIVLALLAWEFAVRVFHIAEFILPAPTSIAASMTKWWSPIAVHALQTLETTIIGFAAANVLGLALGALIGSSAMVYGGIYPLLIAFNSIPKVAVVPILVIWFGIGSPPAIITSFLMSFFPITVNVAAGIATVEPELRDVLRALGASRRTIIAKVGLPRSMPFYFASLKIAITSSFLGSILAETVAGQSGIGHLMIVASSRFEVPLVFAGLIVTSAMSVAMYAIAAVVEKRVTGWANRGGAEAGA